MFFGIILDMIASLENIIASLDLHDGSFDGLLISEDKSVRLFVRRETGERSTIVLEHVEVLSVANFRQGNIIFDFVFVDSSKLTHASIERVYQLGDAELDVARRMLVKAKEQCLSVLEINPSYGAECSFLFKTLAVVPDYVLSASK